MAYSPSPLAKVVDGQNYGTGLCTPKRAYTPGSYTNVCIFQHEITIDLCRSR